MYILLVVRTTELILMKESLFFSASGVIKPKKRGTLFNMLTNVQENLLSLIQCMIAHLSQLWRLMY